MSPELFLARRFASLSDEEGRLEGTPNTFVSIGILATFIGLGLAVKEAMGANDFEAMKGTLNIIAFKFQTSIWGIALSLFFQSLFVDRYFVKKQDLWDKLTIQLFQMEGDSSRLLLEKQNSLLEKAFADQENNSAEREERVMSKLQTQHDAMTAFFKKQTDKLLESSSDLTEKVMESFVDLEECNMEREKRIMAKSQTQHETMTTLFRNHIDKNLASTAEQTNKIIAACKEESSSAKTLFQTQIVDFKSLFKVHIGKVHYAVNKLDDYIAASELFEKSAQAFQADVNKFRKDTSSVLLDMHQTMVDIGDKNHAFLERFELDNKQALSDILHEKEVMQKVFIRSSTDSLKYVEGAVESLLKENRENIHDTYHAAVENLDKVISRVTASTENIDKSVSKMQDSMAAIQSGSELASTKMAASIRDADKELAKFSGVYERTLSAMDAKLDKFAAAIKSSGDSHANILQRMIGEQDARMEKSVKELAGANKDFVQGMAPQLSLYESALKDMKTSVEQLTQALQESESHYVQLLQESIRKQNEQLEAGIREAGVELAKFSDIYEVTLSETNDKLELLAATFEQSSDSYGNLLQSMISEQDVRMEKSVKELAGANKDFVNDMVPYLALYQTSVQDMKNGLDQLGKTLKDSEGRYVSLLEESIRQQNERLEAGLFQLAENHTEFQQIVETAFSQMLENSQADSKENSVSLRQAFTEHSEHFLKALQYFADQESLRKQEIEEILHAQKVFMADIAENDTRIQASISALIDEFSKRQNALPRESGFNNQRLADASALQPNSKVLKGLKAKRKG